MERAPCRSAPIPTRQQRVPELLPGHRTPFLQAPPGAEISEIGAELPRRPVDSALGRLAHNRMPERRAIARLLPTCDMESEDRHEPENVCGGATVSINSYGRSIYHCRDACQAFQCELSVRPRMFACYAADRLAAQHGVSRETVSRPGSRRPTPCIGPPCPNTRQFTPRPHLVPCGRVDPPHHTSHPGPHYRRTRPPRTDLDRRPTSYALLATAKAT